MNECSSLFAAVSSLGIEGKQQQERLVSLSQMLDLGGGYSGNMTEGITMEARRWPARC
jgi:hypothetical protein